MRIHMLETRKVTEDGFVVRQLYAGEVCEVKDHVGYQLIELGRATSQWEKKVVSVPLTYSETQEGLIDEET